jgi:hypothetical protein
MNIELTNRASSRWPCGIFSTGLEIIMNTKETLHIQKTETAKTPDLRKGVHGSLLIEGEDAGQALQSSKADLKIASPDLEVPAGQTTHE